MPRSWGASDMACAVPGAAKRRNDAPTRLPLGRAGREFGGTVLLFGFRGTENFLKPRIGLGRRGGLFHPGRGNLRVDCERPRAQLRPGAPTGKPPNETNSSPLYVICVRRSPSPAGRDRRPAVAGSAIEQPSRLRRLLRSFPRREFLCTPAAVFFMQHCGDGKNRKAILNFVFTRVVNHCVTV